MQGTKLFISLTSFWTNQPTFICVQSLLATTLKQWHTNSHTYNNRLHDTLKHSEIKVGATNELVVKDMLSFVGAQFDALGSAR